MAGPRTPRAFQVNPDVDAGEPICIGLFGYPGAGKTFSALRLAEGICRVRGGKPALVDTEAGRARKYLRPRNPDGFNFDWIPFAPPFEPAAFLDAIHEAEKLKPGAIIVDNMSDEHEGPGGVLEWHDAAVPRSGGNEWAAWKEPKASRRILTSGIQQIRTPIILTFRARPKTTTKPGSKVPVKLGFMPIAGDELLGICDMTCLLPPRSDGVPIWSSDLAGEGFAIKVPNYLAGLIRRGAPLDQDFGEAIGRWQMGIDAPSGGGEQRKRTPEELVDAYIASVNAKASLDELRQFQSGERTQQFIATMREKHPALHDRIINANSRRAQELAPQDEGDEDLGVPADARIDDDDDDTFPGGK